MQRLENSRARAGSTAARAAALSLLLLVFSEGSLPRTSHAFPWVLFFAAIALTTWAAFGIRQQRRSAPRVVILGSGTLASKLIEELGPENGGGVEIAGIIDERPPDAGTQDRAHWLGTPDRLAEIVKDVRADRIVLALSDRRGHLPLKALLESRVRGIVVEDALDLYERLTGKMAIEALTPGSLILSKGFRNQGTPEAVARAVSVAVAVAGLTLLAPLLALIAVAIKLDSKGPVLFVQARAGRDGRPFDLLKFRTMHPAQERRSEWVKDNSDRITRIGRQLRRYRLDELPQLVNILRGEMNLVGPRPHPTCNQEIFERRIAYYALRSTVRPGVTGWAQVRYGYANNIEEETEKMRYDLFYIKNRSLALDARIVLETAGIVAFGQGASEVRWASPLVDSAAGLGPEQRQLAPVPVKLEPLER
jgi:exopolysaccharide biosynthesis polyprenyl glycosylphosphotransferase